MLSKVIYSQANGQVLFAAWSPNLDGIIPEYDLGTHDIATVDVPQDVLDNSSRYFYISPNVIKDYYGTIEISSDQDDSDSDGVEDMVADGVAFATYTVKKKDKDGNYVTDASDNDVISIKADRGLLSDMSKALVNGVMTFTLKSLQETVLITLKISNTKLGRQSTTLQLVP